jgi:hypothetical protein
MKKYFLKPNITDEVLKNYGFVFLETSVGRAAVYEDPNDKVKSMIVILKPPIRQIKHRYQNPNSTLEDLIKIINDLVDERNV